MTTSFLRCKAWVMTGLVTAGWAYGATIDPTLLRLRHPAAPTPASSPQRRDWR